MVASIPLSMRSWAFFFLLWGIQYIAYGANGRGFFEGENFAPGTEISGFWVLLRIVFFISYGITLVYMGITAFMLCQAGGSSRGVDDLEVAGTGGGNNKEAIETPVNAPYPPGTQLATVKAPGGNQSQAIHVHVHLNKDEPVMSDTQVDKIGKSIDQYQNQSGQIQNGSQPPNGVSRQVQNGSRPQNFKQNSTNRM